MQETFFIKITLKFILFWPYSKYSRFSCLGPVKFIPPSLRPAALSFRTLKFVHVCDTKYRASRKVHFFRTRWIYTQTSAITTHSKYPVRANDGQLRTTQFR